jgi:hypothetical protein
MQQFNRSMREFDVINAIGLTLLLLMALLASGCKYEIEKRPVSATFAITVHETDPSPATTLESSSGNALQPKDGAGLDLFRYAVRVRVREQSGQQQITGYGSGVLVQGGVLTAAHVVKTQSTPVIQCEANGQTAYGKTYRCHTDADLAFVEVTWPSPQVVANMAKSLPAANEQVVSVGRAETGDISEVKHTVQGASKWDRNTVLEVTPQFNGGRSGGGLFNTDGELCGIATHTSEKTGIAVGVDAIHELIGDETVVAMGDPVPIEPTYTAWIITRSNCFPCEKFHNTRGNGLGGLRYRYIQVDQKKPDDVPADLWQAAGDVASRRTVPFAMWRTKDNKFVFTDVLDKTHESLMEYVKFSGVPD